MRDVEGQKLKLEQKRNRLNAEESRLKLKERKIRTRRLIEIGGLVIKAGLEGLPTNALYGALLDIASSFETNQSIVNDWIKIGKEKLEKEEQDRIAVIIKFDQEPRVEIRNLIRNSGLRWNSLRKEWYGFVTNLNELKDNLHNVEHSLEIVNS